MMKKRLLAFIFVLTVVGFFIVSAQDVPGSDQVPFINETKKLQEAIEQEKYDYLGEQWKEFLLKNKYISSIDNFFKKINFIFIFLFSRNYSFSMKMFLVFLLWIFTLIALEGYAIFFDKQIYRFLVALAGTIILSWLQIFNLITEGIIKIVFFQSSFLWWFFTWLLVFVLLAVYLYLNKLFAAKINKEKEKAKKKKIEHELEVEKSYREAMREGI